MATTKEFHDYVLEQLQKTGNVTTRKMMGEYCVYYNGKMVGDICDNTLLLKPTESAIRLLPDVERSYPYEGAKTLMLVVEELENTELLTEVFRAMYDELPAPKKKK